MPSQLVLCRLGLVLMSRIGIRAARPWTTVHHLVLEASFIRNMVFFFRSSILPFYRDISKSSVSTTTRNIGRQLIHIS
ncbi:uncharacterized protein EI90DRAFT_3058030 [Cantharellus anzutake]|uniref:uncharacterized protein n=1 Tax=Cantharellus anzutake TaxID=1750568 RepID=UPI001903350E|nr:uncharacterized protein EI90DRAFT_3058030 [Cantharellus anzutake]KAF8331474.1 hypothetical protein EI90DRAFT_3058030 [Cantharellus anzutake]